MLKKTKIQNSTTAAAAKFQKKKRAHFSQGLRVLAIDDNVVCLKVLAFTLEKCGYHVTTTMDASEAIEMLRKNENGYDIVITDVIRSDMDGFKLLEIIGLEMDTPVIMTSANSDIETIEKGVKHGARDYLVKPVRMEILKNIWQHVIRKTIYCPKPTENFDEADNYNNTTAAKEEDQSTSREESPQAAYNKKSRVEWTPELHAKFVDAVRRLEAIGEKEKVVPKYILKFMNEPQLTRQQIASHLQKYRLTLEKQKKQRETSMEVIDINHLGTRHICSDGANFSGLGSINGYVNNSYNLFGNSNKRFKSTPNPVHHHLPTGYRCQNLLPFQDVHQSQHTSPNVASMLKIARPGPTLTTTNQSQPDLGTIMHRTSQIPRNSSSTNGYHEQMPPQVHIHRPPPVVASPGNTTPAGSFAIWGGCNSNPCNQPKHHAYNSVGNGFRLSAEDPASQRITAFSQSNSKDGLIRSYLPGHSEERNLPTFSDHTSSVNHWSAIATGPTLGMRDQIDSSSEENGCVNVVNESDKRIHGHCDNERYYDSDDEIRAMVRQFSHNPAPSL